MSKIPPPELISTFSSFIEGYALRHCNMPFNLIAADLDDLNCLFYNFQAGNPKASAALLGRLFTTIREEIPQSICEYIRANA